MGNFYIGKFKIEPGKNKVSLPKAEFRLEPRVMAILCYLVEHQGQVLSKDKVLTALWPNQTLEPELVTKAVFEIRKILNDNPKSPQFIETIPRKGYVFIGKVESNTHKLKLSPLLLLSIFICALIMLFLHQNAQQKEVELVNLTTKKTIRHISDGEIGSISVNNRNQLLFTHKTHALTKLYLHDNKTLNNTLLETQSPKIKDIFSASSSDYIINCDDVCSVVKRSKSSVIPLITLNERIVKLSVSPNENWLAIQTTKHNRHNVVLISLQEKDPKSFYLPHDGSEKHPIFANNESLYYISQTADRKTYLASYNIVSGKTTTKPLPIDRVGSLSLYSGSKFVISGRYNGQYALWLLALEPLSLSVLDNIDPQQKVTGVVVDTKSKTIHYAIQNRPITIQSKGELSIKIDHPSLNLDGLYLANTNHLIFSSNRSGSYEVWLESDGQQSKLTDISASYIHTIKVDNTENLIAFSYTKDKTKHIAIYSLLNKTIMSDITIKNDSYLLNFDHTSTHLFISQRATQNYDLVSLNIKNKTLSKLALNAGITAQSDQNGVYFYSFNKHALVYQTHLGETITLFDFSNEALNIRANSIKLIANGFFYLSKIDTNQVISFYDFYLKLSKPLFMLSHSQFVTDFGFIDSNPYIIFDENKDVTSQIISLEVIN